MPSTTGSKKAPLSVLSQFDTRLNREPFKMRQVFNVLIGLNTGPNYQKLGQIESNKTTNIFATVKGGNADKVTLMLSLRCSSCDTMSAGENARLSEGDIDGQFRRFHQC
jgi:hypothetical protein